MKRLAPHLSDQVLARGLAAAVVQEGTATAVVLDHIAEFDARKLYLPAAHPSMFAYCVGELHLSEDAAYKRIQAARAAGRFPAVLDAVADGRLHLSAVCLLAPHLTDDTAGELLAAATHRSKSEIERLLGDRFPRPDVPTRVQAIAIDPRTAPADPPAPGPLAVDGQTASERVGQELQLAPAQVQGLPVPARVDDRARVKPLAPQRFAVQFTMSQSADDKLGYAQELLGHQVPAGDHNQYQAECTFGSGFMRHKRLAAAEARAAAKARAAVQRSGMAGVPAAPSGGRLPCATPRARPA